MMGSDTSLYNDPRAEVPILVGESELKLRALQGSLISETEDHP
jgi:hypothetical protein